MQNYYSVVKCYTRNVEVPKVNLYYNIYSLRLGTVPRYNVIVFINSAKRRPMRL
jgi:hypothetical protein